MRGLHDKVFIDNYFIEATMLNGKQISRIYANPLRQRILAHVGKAGPCTQTEVARALDMAAASARHHLLKLQAAGFVLQRKTRKGPHGITELLFEAPKTSKGRKPMQWSTKHGTHEDFAMRKLNLDDVLETHRVGSRIIMRDPAAFFAINNLEIDATREELVALRDRIKALLIDFAQKLPSPAKRKPGQKLEHCKLHLGIYPAHAQSTV
jgi:DNA-binding transcriptional ArsR family regulator